MRLTLAEVKRYAASVAYGYRVVGAEWIGKRSKEKHGPAHFRVARVTFAAKDGPFITKFVTVSTDGYRRLA